jgi:hypothetical protein
MRRGGRLICAITGIVHENRVRGGREYRFTIRARQRGREISFTDSGIAAGVRDTLIYDRVNT